MLLSRLTVGCVVLLAASLAAACGGSHGGGDIGSGSEGGAAPDSGGGSEDGGPLHDGGGGDAGSDGSTDASDDVSSDGSFVTAAHTALPQVVNLKGTLLTAPKVLLIAYTEDPVMTDADDMITELTHTTTWSEQTSQYGIGPITKLPTLQIAGTPPTTLDDQTGTVTPFEQTLVTNTTGTDPVWGAADPNTIYTFLLPLGTNIESDGSCCTDFLGYHYEVAVSASVTIPYAIICDCPPVQGVPLTSLEFTTTTISHELVEAATDPRPNSDPAYVQSDDNDVVWSYVTGGEIADMCEYNSDSNYTPPGSTYMVQRTWSNAAVPAGTNPCLPVPTTNPFFDSIAVLPDTVTIGGTTTKAVTIPVGSSKTIDVQLYSSAPTTGPWMVTAYDMNDYLGNGSNTTVSLDKNTGSNGDVLHLTIQVNSTDPDFGGEGFILVSDLAGQENMSMGAVAN